MSSGQRLSELSNGEFDALIEGHIERVAGGYGDLPAEVFIDLLVERAAAQSGTPVTLSIAVRGDQLEITPDRESADVLVQGNEVLIGGRRLVLHLTEHTD
jgi:hypothetical protein